MNLQTIRINNIQDKASILEVAIALRLRTTVMARSDALPHPPHPGRNVGRVSRSNGKEITFRVILLQPHASRESIRMLFLGV